jgi:hypothetical protein
MINHPYQGCVASEEILLQSHPEISVVKEKCPFFLGIAILMACLT